MKRKRTHDSIVSTMDEGFNTANAGTGSQEGTSTSTTSVGEPMGLTITSSKATTLEKKGMSAMNVRRMRCFSLSLDRSPQIQLS